MRPVMLVIMDGWGWRETKEGNAVAAASTPNLDRFEREYPFALLDASGLAVGLPEGQMGNSEVGHTNLGAGRVVYQELTRINMAVYDGSFFENRALKGLMDSLSGTGGDLHLMGLVSDGGVHSSTKHLYALIRMAAMNGVRNLFIHAFMDGRDTPPDSGLSYMDDLVSRCKETGTGKVATVSGRFYAMDRDNRWDRIEQAFKAVVAGEGVMETDPVQAIKNAYAAGETDEFIKPAVIRSGDEMAAGRIKDGDGIIFFNFRADRARELVRALTEPGFSEFDVSSRPKITDLVTMTMYDASFNLPVAFPPETLVNILGEEVSRAGLKQLRIAETEKYAHVTYFFNGGREEPFEGEDRVLIPSPREVRTYDEKPEMSAFEVTEELLKRIESGKYSLIVVNYANGDMVGHTGIMDAAVKACTVVDECVGRVVDAWTRQGGAALVTADHGNAEIMLDDHGNPVTAHSTSPVPLYLVDDKRKYGSLEMGKLADVAPTILEIMGLKIPAEMTGIVLVRG